MAAFINNDITTAGLIVLAKGVAGQKINYTKIVLGDGYLEEGQTPRTLTGVVSPKATVDITKLKINGDGTVAVGGIFTNGDETEGFYYRELGLYAEDPDPEVGEVLYCYGNCGDLAEWIPPSGGATIVEKTIDIVTAIGTATNVTAYIPADAYATKEDYETYKAIALGAQATAEEALALARQAITIAQAAEASVNDLSNAVGQNTSKIATLWDAVFSEITTNPFQITFADLTGITLTAGIWNSGLQRLECETTGQRPERRPPMYRGTTPTITINCDIDVSEFVTMWVTFRTQQLATYAPPKQVEVTKHLGDEGVDVTDKVVTVSLTQADTLLLGSLSPDEDQQVEVQIRGRTEDGRAFASNIMAAPLSRILKDGVI